MSSPVEKIKERLSIVEVIGSYITLEKAGRNYRALSPFRNERTPSFFVSPERGTYYDFGEGSGGDMFTFVQRFEGLDFNGALKVLAKKAGIDLIAGDSKKKKKQERLYSLLEESVSYFEGNLSKEVEVLQYLEKRGLTEKSIKLFRIGFAKEAWQDALNFLQSKGFSKEDVKAAGLVKTATSSSSRLYDRFRGRVLFPIFDTSGRPVAFSGRIFKDDGKSAKYINSPETELFKKSDTLYGLHLAKEFIRKMGFCVVVEGQVDLVLSHQSGFKNTVALSGTSLSEELFVKKRNERPEAEEERVNNLGLVKRLTDNLVIACDSDEAGTVSTKKNAELALSLGMNVKVAELPKGQDPADLILKNSSLWKKAIKNSKFFVDFLLDSVDDFAHKEKEVIEEVRGKFFPLMFRLPGSMEKDRIISKISERLNISKEAISEEFKEFVKRQNLERGSRGSFEEKAKKSSFSKKERLQRKIAGYLMYFEDLKNGEPEKNLLDKIESLSGMPARQLISFFNEEKDVLLFEIEAENLNLSPSDSINACKELVRHLEREILLEKRKEATRELKRAEKEGDEQAVETSLRRFTEISKSLDEF